MFLRKLLNSVAWPFTRSANGSTGQLPNVSSFIKSSVRARHICEAYLQKNVSPDFSDKMVFALTLILTRVLRSQAAIETLIKSGFPEEAALVCLTQFELRLDALFICRDPSRAEQWIAHESERHQPWPVQTKIKDIYSQDPDKLDAQLRGFKLLSSIKHGNPVAGVMGFRAGICGDKIGVFASQQKAQRAGSIYMAGICTFGANQLSETLAGVMMALREKTPVEQEFVENVLRQLDASNSELQGISAYF